MDQESSPPVGEQSRADAPIVNRQLIDALHAQGVISREARLSALRFAYPHDQWGRWSARLLLLIGSALILSGMIYFFAFNWAQLPAMFKLSLVTSVMVGCTLGAYVNTLASLTGRVLLLSASVSVGVFMAVFGQIYQTGADAYELFMMWSLLILGWTAISRFAAQWMLWIIITNLFLLFWWKQVGYDSLKTEVGLRPSLIIFNGIMLVGHEYALRRLKYAWLTRKWTHQMLSLLTISTSFFILAPWILARRDLSAPQHWSMAFAAIVQLGFFGYYRKVAFDLWSVALVTLSGAILLDLSIWRALTQSKPGLTALTFMMGLVTLGIFSAATLYLRNLMRTSGGTDV